jgi:hypothetical protein
MNPDVLQLAERCASTSNRNFEGCQGRGGRTHLVQSGHGRRCRDRLLLHRSSPIEVPMTHSESSAESSRHFRADVDTDQIMPKQFLKRISAMVSVRASSWTGAPIRSSSSISRAIEERRSSSPEKTSVVVRARARAWALLDADFRTIISPSFADMFLTNCTNNGAAPNLRDQ